MEKDFALIQTIGQPALYEQLAEEAVELAKEALKCARVLRNENPTPVKFEEAKIRAIEELTDLWVCVDALNLYVSTPFFYEKMNRWKTRIEEVRREFFHGDSLQQ